MKNLDCGRGHGRNFDHLTMVTLKFWPWSWSKIFDHMTMTPGRRPNGLKSWLRYIPQIVRGPDLLLFQFHCVLIFLFQQLNLKKERKSRLYNLVIESVKI